MRWDLESYLLAFPKVFIPYLPLLAALVVAGTSLLVARIQIKAKERQEAKDWFVQYYVFEGVDRLLICIEEMLDCTRNAALVIVDVPDVPTEAIYRVGELVGSRFLLSQMQTMWRILNVNREFTIDLPKEDAAKRPQHVFDAARERHRRALVAVESVIGKLSTQQKTKPFLDHLIRHCRRFFPKTTSLLGGFNKDAHLLVSPTQLVKDGIADIKRLQKESDDQEEAFRQKLRALQGPLLEVHIRLTHLRGELVNFPIDRKYNVTHLKAKLRKKNLGGFFDDMKLWNTVLASIDDTSQETSADAQENSMKDKSQNHG